MLAATCSTLARVPVPRFLALTRPSARPTLCSRSPSPRHSRANCQLQMLPRSLLLLCLPLLPKKNLYQLPLPQGPHLRLRQVILHQHPRRLLPGTSQAVRRVQTRNGGSSCRRRNHKGPRKMIRIQVRPCAFSPCFYHNFISSFLHLHFISKSIAPTEALTVSELTQLPASQGGPAPSEPELEFGFGGRQLSLDERAIVLGMAILIDFDYFSHKSSSRSVKSYLIIQAVAFPKLIFSLNQNLFYVCLISVVACCL